MNELDDQILKIILEMDKPVTSKSLSILCSVSINTIRKEIELINDEIKDYGFQIEAKKSVGHYIEIMDKQQALPVINHLHSLYERNSRLDMFYSKKAYYILRRLFTMNESITMEKLIQELNCRDVEVRKALKKAKQYLADFHLIVQNSRKKGLYVKGDEWNKRQCLLHLHKSYMINFDADDPLNEVAFKELFLANSQMDYGSRVSEIVNEECSSFHKIVISSVHMPKIINYILLSSARYKYKDALMFTDKQLEEVSQGEEIVLANQIVKALKQKVNLRFDDNLNIQLTMLIKSYEDQNDTLRSDAAYQKYYMDVDEFIVYIKSVIVEETPLFDEDFRNELALLLYCWVNRYRFKIYNDTEPHGQVDRIGIISSEYSLQFAKFFCRRYGVPIKEVNALESYYIFYRTRYERMKHFYAMHIVVCSFYGIACANSIVSNLKRSYARDIRQIEAKQVYELKGSDMEDVDLIITDTDVINWNRLINIDIPILSLDYHPGEYKYTVLDDYYRNLKDATERIIMHRESIIYTDFYHKEQVFEYLAQTLGKDDVQKEEIAKELIENDEIINLERKNHIVLCPLFSRATNLPLILVMINRNSFLWNDHLSQIFIYYRRGDNVMINHILSSILSRFIHMDTERYNRLTTDFSIDPMKILYP